MAKKRRKNRRSAGKRFLNLVLLVASLGIFMGGVLALWVASLPLPDFNSFDERKIAESTKIYDRTGEIILFDIHKDIKRKIIPLEDMSRQVRNATVAIEDSEFYEHKGVKPKAILRAFTSNILSGETKGQGGSTITQQVIKNALLTKEKKYSRKIKEAVLAIKLEQVMSKDEILAHYLNESPYGGSVYGIEEASLAFFGKRSKDLTLPESAYMAALPNAPTYYSPYGSNTDELEARKNLVLERMVELNFITREEADEAKGVEVVFIPPEDGGIKAPHFVMFVKEYLENRYGIDAVETQGFKVVTTLDWNLQQKAEEIITKYGDENEEKFNSTNAGAVIMDPKTGQILSMVGSRNYFDVENNGNFNITTAHRQPGSSFKPFVYATAFKEGYTPNTILFDTETHFSARCDEKGIPKPGWSAKDCYNPNNYDFRQRGPVTVREALAQSINIPAVKMLYLAGLHDSLKTARDLGITSLDDPDRYGLTLVLGGGEVSLLEMTNAYSVFATGGQFNPHTAILKVEDREGNSLEEFSLKTKTVLDEQVALQITDILSDNNARGPAFGYASPMQIPGRDVAIKTGTTNNFRDAWSVGYATNIAVGAWAGNNDNTPMEKKVAGYVIAPMWNALIKAALASLPDEKFKKPKADPDADTLKPVLRGDWGGSYTYYVDSVSGKLATEYTPEETKEKRTLMQVHSMLYWVDKNDPRGPIPKNPADDPQFELWEYGVKKWAQSQGISEETFEDIPTEFDDVHKPEFSPEITILSPQSGNKYSPNTKINVEIQVNKSKYPIEQADIFFNQTLVGTVSGEPFVISFTPKNMGVNNQSGTVTVRVYDSVRNSTEESVKITILSI